MSTATSHRRLAALPSRGALLDVAIAAGAFAGSLALLRHGGIGPSRSGSGELDLVGVVLTTCSTVPLLAWRRLPLGVFAVTAAASVLLAGLGYRVDLLLGPTVALYLLAASRNQDTPWTLRTAVAVVGLLVAYLAAAAATQRAFPASELLHTGLAWAVAWFAGERTRLRRERVAELSDRAVRVEREAERERLLARRGTRPDRPRSPRLGRPCDQRDRRPRRRGPAAAPPGPRPLARRPGGDRGVGPADGRRDRPARRHAPRRRVGEWGCRGPARPCLARHPDRPPSGRGARADPRHRGRVAAAWRRRRSGRLPDPPGGAHQRRPHGAGSARIGLAFGDAALRLSVTNPVPAGRAARSGGGHGLIGMRERAALVGGDLDAERANGEFRVRARIPYRGHRP